MAMAAAPGDGHHARYKDAVNLTVSLCLTYSLCIAAVRVWIRRGAYGVDDAIIAVATVLTLCHTACDYTVLARGLGLPWATLQAAPSLPRLEEASIAGVILFLLALYLSKCAMLAFLGRITRCHRQVMLYHLCNAVVAVLGVASVLIATVNCSSEVGFYWAFHANRPSCAGQSQRWQAITALDLVTEVLLLFLPVQLIWGLHMPTMKKLMLILAFFLRLPALGFSIGRNYFTLELARPTTDPGLDAAIVVIWLEVQLSYALAASTLSALKTFTETFNSGFGQGFTRGKSDSSSHATHISSLGSPSKTGHPSVDARSKSLASSGKSVIHHAREIDLEALPPSPPGQTSPPWHPGCDDASPSASTTMLTNARKMSEKEAAAAVVSCRELSSASSATSMATTVFPHASNTDEPHHAAVRVSASQPPTILPPSISTTGREAG